MIVHYLSLSDLMDFCRLYFFRFPAPPPLFWLSDFDVTGGFGGAV